MTTFSSNCGGLLAVKIRDLGYQVCQANGDVPFGYTVWETYCPTETIRRLASDIGPNCHLIVEAAK